MRERILVINPGSTSTRIALYIAEEELFNETVVHPADLIAMLPTVCDQLNLRLMAVREKLRKHEIEIGSLDFIMARGGALRPIHGGVWRVSPAMIDDLRSARYGDHASSLGALIAVELAAGAAGNVESRTATACPPCGSAGLPVCIADPPVIDEMDEIARIAGHPECVRISRLHGLNQKATARRAARDLGINYADARLIVAHLGGGISVGVHREGRIVDVNDAYDGEGPFSPERSGTLPAGQVAAWCFAPGADPKVIRKRMVGRGGVYAYLGTTDLREVERRIAEGDQYAALILEAMIYQTAKEIGAAAAVLSGRVDAVVLTGSIVKSDWIRTRLVERTAFIARVLEYPGENEMTALRDAALRVLHAGEEIFEYSPEPERYPPEPERYPPEPSGTGKERQ